MRRAHLAVVPAFLHVYGLRPWEVQWLSPLELGELIEQLPRMMGGE